MEENRSTEAKEYIKELYKRTWEDYRASHQRFDYLLVTVDGAGIYLTLELMKFLYEQKIPITFSLKVCGVSLALSIIFNLVSQLCSYNLCKNILLKEKVDLFPEKNKVQKYKERAKSFSVVGSSSMFLSILLMIIGVIGLIFFLCVVF